MNRNIKPTTFRGASFLTKKQFLNWRRIEKWERCHTCEPLFPRAQTGGCKFVYDRKGRPAKDNGNTTFIKG